MQIDDDLLLISDVDEIPNFNSINLSKDITIKLLYLSKLYFIINLIDIFQILIWHRN